MSFLRRNSEPDDAQAVPAQQPSQPPPAAAQEDSRGGIIGWIGDTYNGLYKVTLQPHMPKWSTIIKVLVGLIIGLIWGYLLVPTIFYNANPNRLNADAQQQWVRMVAVSFEPGARYGTDEALALLSRVPNPAETIDGLLENPEITGSDRQALQTLRAVVPEDAVGAEPVEPTSTLQQLLTSLLIPALLILIITPIFYLLWNLIIQPIFFVPLQDRVRQATDKEYAAVRQKEQATKAATQQEAKLRAELAKQSSDEELGKPVMQNVAVYTPNRQFDESYEIELPLDMGGDFLGQSGVVISEAVDPDPVAIEMWLFDMFSQQNLKRIFVTPTGYADPSIRSRLEADVDDPSHVIVAAPGTTARIESDKIVMIGKMIAVDFNSQGRYENFQMQVRAWQKKAGAAVPLPAAGGLPDYSDLTFDPPPPMPSSTPPAQTYAPPPPAQPNYGSSYDPLTPPPQQQSYGSGYDPLTPPPQQQSYGSGYDPLSPPQQQSYGSGYDPLTPPPLPPQQQPPQSQQPDDDDPFGGTGDFTPLPRN